jgi:hypothetical protein
MGEAREAATSLAIGGGDFLGDAEERACGSGLRDGREWG